MRETSEAYKQLVQGSTRHIGFRVALKGDRSFYPVDIIEISISRAISDGFQIGACGSDRLCLVTTATDRVDKGSRLAAYSYPGDDLNDTEPLGVFFAEEVSTENGVTTIVAYDRMNRNLDNEVKWTHSTAPSFPCTQQDILDYLCARKGITCNFACQPFTVQTKPVGYTAREIIGFIAACHAANAHFTADDELIFKQFTKTDAVIDRLRCYSHAAGNDDGFTVNGVLFDIGNDTQIYIDGDANEYDDEADGIVEVFCPFVTIEVAEYVWHNLGGLNYYSCAIEMPAENLLEVGDVYTTTNAQGQEVQSVVIEQELSVSIDRGYRETISAAAESNSNQRATTNRVSSAESSIAGSSTGSALKEYSVISDNEITYNGTTYTFTTGDSGEITEVTTDKGGYFAPVIPATLADISMHNAAFMAVAMLSRLNGEPEPAGDIPDCFVRFNLDDYTEDGTTITLHNQAGNGSYIATQASVSDGGIAINTANSGYGVADITTTRPAEWTCYLVIKGGTGTDRGFYIHRANSETNWHLVFGTGGGSYWIANFNNSATMYTSSQVKTDKCLLTVSVRDGGANYYINGVLIAQLAPTGVTLDASIRFISGRYAGRYYDSGTPQTVYDIALSATAHDAATVGEVSTMLMNKYNIGG